MKKVKEINGIKIINRYTCSTFFSGIFSLISASIFIVLLFLPVIILKMDNSSIQNIKGLDFLLYTFQVKKNVFDNIYSTLKPNLVLTYTIFNYVISGFIMLGLLISLFLIFSGLKFIFYGKMKNYGLSTSFSLTIFSILLILNIGLYLYLFFIFKNPNTEIKFNKANILYMYIYLGVSFFCFIVLGIIYSAAFNNKIYIGDISKYDFNSSPKVVYSLISNNGQINGSYSPNSLNSSPQTIKLSVPNVLPAGINTIGGHAFSLNTNLIVANIPNNIVELGPGAFANCPNLKVVSIPKSVKYIGYNCFFNCYNLKRINYAGNKQEWRHIKRGSNWLYKAGTTIVVCKDGPIFVNAYH